MGLFLANGTRVKQSTISTTADPDPLVKLNTDLYEKKRTGREDDKPQGELTVLFARAGTVLRQSQVNAFFHAAVVHKVSPKSGLAAGGTVVTVEGNHLDGVSGVTVGGAAATAVTVLSDRAVRFTTPAGTAGARDIVIADDKGNTTITGGFTYQ